MNFEENISNAIKDGELESELIHLGIYIPSEQPILVEPTQASQSSQG